MVSALLVALIGSAVIVGLNSTAQISGDQRLRAVAVDLAEQDQERLAGLSDLELSQLNQVPARSVSLDGTTFTITSSATYENSTGGSSCSAGNPGTAYYKLLSDVDWPANLRTDVREESLIDRPTAGNLLAEVQDQTGAGVPGATITATGGPTNESAMTDSLGCATFEGMGSGQYTLTATAPNYVSSTGASSTTTPATVPAAGPATPMILGQAGTIAATFSATGNGSTAG
ncbi:MAG: carboxypeptidase-like regulatory domain-containing protein, partial [Solirubrobacteraceae bacterium]